MTGDGVTTGVLGGRWRGTVTPWGAVQPWDGGPALDWHVAADDRWHTPADEPTVRQRRVDGTPVVETRIRVPNGDAVQRVYSTADAGGLTVLEFTNDSTLPIAVAFTRSDVLTARPPTDVPVQGIDLPAGSVVLPVGHQATVAVALRHDGGGAGPLPTVSPLLHVVRGWTAMAERAGRLVLPDEALVADIVAIRCDLALEGPDDPADDPASFLVGVGQLVRMGERPDPWLPDVAAAVEGLARRGGEAWLVEAAFDAVALVLHRAGERRAAADLDKVRARWARTVDGVEVPSGRPPGGAALLAWIDRWCATAGGALLPMGLPASWLGAPVEVYDVPVGATSRVSFALRWHGTRPAVLWEVSGEPVALSSPVLAAQWHSADPRGETLWPDPVLEGYGQDRSAGIPPEADGVSFS